MKKEPGKEQLIMELARLRSRVYELETSKTKIVGEMSKSLAGCKKRVSQLEMKISSKGKN